MFIHDGIVLLKNKFKKRNIMVKECYFECNQVAG